MTHAAGPAPLGGYVLAGGHSSRMGRDKALLSLAGKPLAEHAVTKLRRICSDVSILSANLALAAFAPIVPDIHPNSGPIGGIEAALKLTTYDWNLLLPVDMPLLPGAVVERWVFNQLRSYSSGTLRPGIRILTADGRPQPGLCLIHKALAPFITSAIQRGHFALLSVFEEAGKEAGYHFSGSALPPMGKESPTSSGPFQMQLTSAQRAAQHLWFLNLNTKEDLALAAAHSAALDT